ncbi:hypothetical protein [Halanaerobacter jeridensis]|uniref:Uncharacterized protein n=1 Tax=Halanaerobacter jeridensis TaxID=706427 RepID=A0A938XWP8_9FIRM|nr:hypothetical protein [Halanaerobacter jeridensis]MBM7558199.1 hypothetical protein [Halanaerobacter jeridensis]
MNDFENSEEKIRKEINNKIDRVAQRIYDYGWPISPNIDQLELMFLGGKDESTYKFFDEDGNELEISEGIDQHICNIFRKNNYQLLKTIVDDWELKIFKRRKHIWNQCIKAHIDENYILSTYTLAIQIEGLLEEFNMIYSYSEGGQLSILVDDFVSWFPNKINTNLDGISEVIFNSFIENIKFLSKSTYNIDKKSIFYQQLNRNYIAHSKLTDTNEVLSLKCFLLLDLIHFSFDIIQ